MTRIAVISDVHADVHALQTALRWIDKMGCDRILCAGDLVDYGCFPDETLDLLQQRAIPCIRGNHDRWAVQVGSSGRVTDRSGWSLRKRSLRFLADLPPSWETTVEGVRVAMHHASPGSDMAGMLPGETTGSDLRRALDKAAADVLIVGHTHVACRLLVPDGGIVVNPGSLLCNPAAEYGGEPSDDGAVPPNPAGGTFGVLELPSLDFTVYQAATGRPVNPD